MTGVLDMLAGELGPTATYARRDVLWIPARPGQYPDGRDGTAVVKLQHSRRIGAKFETDAYGIEREESEAFEVRGVSFLLLNDSDDTQWDVYRTVVGPECSCTCTAGRVDRHECKHIATCRWLLEEGVF